MEKMVYLDDDIVRVYEPGAKKSTKSLLSTLFWGDRVKLVKEGSDNWIVELPRCEWNQAQKKYLLKSYRGRIPKEARFRESPLLKVRFVDVGQGDAAIVESPKERLLLIDGGQGDHLRRYVTRAFSHQMTDHPLHCEAVIVSHGDADHFSGLTRLLNARSGGTAPPVTVNRVFHSGLVKGTAKKDVDLFGRTKEIDGETYVVELADDLRTEPDSRMNKPFKEFRGALRKLRSAEGSSPIVRALKYGDDAEFGFLHDEGIAVQVLGPITTIDGNRPALLFMKKPGSSSLSASHTINGHSIVLRLVFGNVRFLFGADLNEESQERLVKKVEGSSLRSEVFKVPHHGSADFSPKMLAAVRPVVSVISSGDESTSVEYIHPRAGLVGAIGKYSREDVEKPLVYITETVAFFESLGKADIYRYSDRTNRPSTKKETCVNTYNKKTFGIVHVRTDGKRVLVATHSGKDEQKEAYVFTLADNGRISFADKPRTI